MIEIVLVQKTGCMLISPGVLACQPGNFFRKTEFSGQLLGCPLNTLAQNTQKLQREGGGGGWWWWVGWGWVGGWGVGGWGLGGVGGWGLGGVGGWGLGGVGVCGWGCGVKWPPSPLALVVYCYTLKSLEFLRICHRKTTLVCIAMFWKTENTAQLNHYSNISLNLVGKNLI